MLIKSKFSKLYLARPMIFIPLGFFAVLFSSINYFNEGFKMQERIVMIILGLLTFAISIGSINDIFNMYSILVDREKMTTKNIITGKKELFYYNDIISVNSRSYRKYLMKGVPINNGYFSRIYTLKDGRILELSPEAYENYNTLITSINTYTSHLK